MDDRKKKVMRLQENLSAVRKLAGWTMEELGDKIGITKQTVSNLENKKSEMTLTQYIAIRAVLQCEIEAHNDNELLAKAVAILVDYDDIDEDSYNNARSGFDDISKAVSAGVAIPTLVKLLSSILVLPNMPISALLKATVSGIWIYKLLGREDKYK